MLWQLSFLQCQYKASDASHQHVSTISLQPWGQVSNVCSLRVSQSVFNRGSACHSRVSTQTTAAMEMHSKRLWYENDDKCNKLNTGEGKWQPWWVSVKKCDSPAGVAARFLRGKMSLLLFKLIVLSYSNCNSHRALHSAAPPAQSCVFQWPTVASCAIWPFVLSQGVKEHQINSMHWRIKSLGFYHTKASRKCVAFLQSPRRRQLPLHCMHTRVKSAALI